ncbi:hypothetical protein [Paracoccus sp. S-4012]|uniref:hypothetical protein n=1 Tax=Paracoccus sp. S-4012 TaxID=2665648 RepID=UPI0018A1EC56|nr:hypothetical protein [Paracoccus sp. S-4012]
MQRSGRAPIQGWLTPSPPVGRAQHDLRRGQLGLPARRPGGREAAGLRIDQAAEVLGRRLAAKRLVLTGNGNTIEEAR